MLATCDLCYSLFTHEIYRNPPSKRDQGSVNVSQKPLSCLALALATIGHFIWRFSTCARTRSHPPVWINDLDKEEESGSRLYSSLRGVKWTRSSSQPPILFLLPALTGHYVLSPKAWIPVKISPRCRELGPDGIDISSGCAAVIINNCRDKLPSVRHHHQQASVPIGASSRPQECYLSLNGGLGKTKKYLWGHVVCQRCFSMIVVIRSRLSSRHAFTLPTTWPGARSSCILSLPYLSLKKKTF